MSARFIVILVLAVLGGWVGGTLLAVGTASAFRALSCGVELHEACPCPATTPEPSAAA